MAFPCVVSSPAPDACRSSRVNAELRVLPCAPPTHGNQIAEASERCLSVRVLFSALPDASCVCMHTGIGALEWAGLARRNGSQGRCGCMRIHHFPPRMDAVRQHAHGSSPRLHPGLPVDAWMVGEEFWRECLRKGFPYPPSRGGFGQRYEPVGLFPPPPLPPYRGRVCQLKKPRLPPPFPARARRHRRIKLIMRGGNAKRRLPLW
jgi:hypothetical protein